MIDIARSGILGQAQLDHIAQVAKTIEGGAVAVGFKIVPAQPPCIREQCNNGDAEIGGGLGGEQVRPRGHRAEQAQWNVGVVIAQPL